MTIQRLPPPAVHLAGDHDHGDFVDVVAELRSGANLVFEMGGGATPELVVIAESRPGAVGRGFVEAVRRAAPLAGVVTLLGTWSEGQARASRPAYDTLRLYWYEFVPWWRRQLALRARGRCPDWARPECVGFQTPPTVVSECISQNRLGEEDSPIFPRRLGKIGTVPDGFEPSSCGVIVVDTPRWDTADALGDLFQRAGYSTVWQRRGRDAPVVRGAVAGIWEGGQLDDVEVEELTTFCRGLAGDGARVIALLDFPRRDGCEIAREAGAAAVLGKPWINADLLAAIDDMGRAVVR